MVKYLQIIPLDVPIYWRYLQQYAEKTICNNMHENMNRP